MKFNVKLNSGNLPQANYPVLVVPAFEDPALPPDLRELDKAWKGMLSDALKSEVLTEEGELYIVPNPTGKGIKRVAFVGMGKSDECDLETLRRVAGTAANSLRKRDVGRICFLVEPFVTLDYNLDTVGQALLEGARLGSYSFDQFKTEKDTHVLSNVELHLPKHIKTRDMVPMLDETLALTSSTLLARDWCNTPGNLATPSDLARLAKDIGKEAGLNVKILDENECRKLGMGAFLGVSRGSDEPPKFIVVDYKPRQHKKIICLVGKAITFDSGGISLKPGKDMHLMKADKGGGLAVLATMRAVGILQPENVRIVGIVPACENLPDGRATKPGDILTTMSGKSIEVLNTDAEGRLILADGLEYACREYSPDVLIDVATLTGACVVALGQGMSGYWTEDKHISESIEKASEISGEKTWRMPLFKPYDELLKSDCADTANIGNQWGGAITAALFLSKFVGDTPWMHLDIAGPFWAEKATGYLAKGATGYGPRLLYRFISQWNK